MLDKFQTRLSRRAGLAPYEIRTGRKAMRMRSLAMAATLLLVTTPAGAATCEWMADQVDKAVMSHDISDEVKRQIISLRDEAEDFGPRDDDNFCQDPLLRAMAILNIKLEP